MKAGRTIYALAQLSERERLLLLVLGVIVIPLAVVFLAVMPLLEARNSARAEADRAHALLEWVSEQVRAMPADGAEAAAPLGTGAEPIGISGIEESLVRVDLRPHVSQLSNRAEGGVDLTLEGAPFGLLGDWLLAMVPVWGYELAAFRLETVSPGIVNASFELEAAR